jgi:serine phosphatase RsbU (regulator of sigma subunit)
MRISIVAILIILAHLAFGQAELGLPIVKNYEATKYNASVQNWCAVQDNRGIMYFGNQGVLEYDGANWRLHKTSKESTIRSLAVTDNNHILVGGVGEFGYLAPDLKGEMEYVELSNQLEKKISNDVWKTYAAGNDLYFCTNTQIFHFKGLTYFKTINLRPRSSLFTFLIDKKLYIGDYFEGLCEIREDSMVQSIGGGFFGKKDIFSINKESQGELLITTGRNGIYSYAVATGKINKIEEPGLNNFTSNAIAYNHVPTRNYNVFGSLGSGLALINKNLENNKVINKSIGIQDETIINLYQSKPDEPIWTMLDHGISSAYIDFPFHSLSDKNGINGSVYDICEFENYLFVATGVGVYYIDKTQRGNPEFKAIKAIQNQTWELVIYKDPNTKKSFLLVGTINGLFQVDKNLTVNEIKDKQHKDVSLYVYNIYQDKFNPTKVYIGLNKGFKVLEYSNGQWHFNEVYSGLSDVKKIISDKYGNTWVSTQYDGLFKVKGKKEVVEFGKDKGIPSKKQGHFLSMQDSLYYLIKNKAFVYDNTLGLYKQSNILSYSFSKGDQSIEFIDNYNDSIIFLGHKKERNNFLNSYSIKNGQLEKKTSPLEYFKNQPIDKFYTDKNTIIIAVGSTLYFYNKNSLFNYGQAFKSLVRQVINQDNDSILFHGNFAGKLDTILYCSSIQPEEQIPQLSYHQNDLAFHVAAPYFFNEEKTEYSVFLEGNDTKWSNWSTETKIIKNNLHEGNYIFKVKARNVFGVESEIGTYQFSISPPWFRTILAYFIYLAFGVALIILIVKWNTRRLRIEKIRLEGIVRERTREIVEQKNEIEGQRDQISHQKEEITASIQYASKIQRAVLPSAEKACELLRDHFVLFKPRDIVSGDFYWMTESENRTVVIAADCTGHGVPGAFMSMLGVSFLNEIVNKNEISQANIILNQLRNNVKSTLKQKGEEGESKDGMDVALCIIDYEKMKMQFAGAYNPLYLYRNSELIEVKADKNPIGIYIREKESFTNHEIELEKGDTMYIFSDGFVDQFGGPKGQKFKSKHFKELLLSIQDKTMTEQHQILDKTITEWRGDIDQIDDVLVIGIRV